VLLDIKGWDPDRHLRLTGMDIGPTLTFARRLGASRMPIWLRFVLVPGLTDDLAEIRTIADFAASLGTVERVDVLPFHQMGQYKWARLGLPYPLQDVDPPSNDSVEHVRKVFENAGLVAY
jgi:pyruvate formate lyase activating enzyme